MQKLLLIGIDSLDPNVLKRYENFLPTFKKLRDECPKMKLESVFPVDSIPAWSTIYTGWNPARHGIVKAFDVFDNDLSDILKIDNSIFKGKTFWDYASQANKQVCILFPMLTFPPWELNGIMLSKTLKEQKVEKETNWKVQNESRSYPSWLADKYKIPKYMEGVSGKHPGVKNLKDWAEDVKKVLLSEAKLGLDICKNEDWDLFFIYFSWLDIIQHRLWRFFDESDPSYPGRNKYENIVKEFYILFDQIISNFINLYPDLTTIVFSDHGHGVRPTKVVNINKALREEGLLFSSSTKIEFSSYLTEKIKLALLETAKQFELDFWLVDLSTKTKLISSMSKRVYTSTGDNSTKNICRLSNFAGIKSYSHGGIEIEKRNLIDEKDYDQICNKIIRTLLSIKDPETDEKLFEWVIKREDLYCGPNVHIVYPDVVFRLKDNYGTGWNLYSSLVSSAYDHNLASGGHKKECVFLISNLNSKSLSRKSMTLMDISPTILDILGIENTYNFDGKSIFSNQ